MPLLEQLKKSHDLFVRCPNCECEREFSLAQASLFDATELLPPQVLAYLAKQNQDLREQRAALKRRKLQATTKPQIGAQSGIVGKVLDKVAPSLPGFPVASADCRALFEPIDYVVFKGLSAKGRIDCLIFVDVKSGKARLKSAEPQIRRLVLAKKVNLKIVPRAKEIL